MKNLFFRIISTPIERHAPAQAAAPHAGLPRGAAAGWHLGGSERANRRSDEIPDAIFETGMPELPKMPAISKF